MPVPTAIIPDNRTMTAVINVDEMVSYQVEIAVTSEEHARLETTEEFVTDVIGEERIVEATRRNIQVHERSCEMSLD